MADGLLQAVRGLWLADPERPSRCSPSCGCSSQTWEPAGNKEVREALLKLELKAESEAKVFAAAAPPAADEGDAPPNVALSLACFGCARLPSEMGDDREKHPVCQKCRKYKVPTTYWCCVNCPGNPGAWKRHAVYHKAVKRQWKANEDGGVGQQRQRETAERVARDAAQSGDEYQKLVAEGLRYVSQRDIRRAGRTFREAIALRPDRSDAYFNLGAALSNSGHVVEAAQRYLEAKERNPVGSEYWAKATAWTFDMLRQTECAEVAKPEWWNDDELKALSARVVKAVPNDLGANQMRASVLCGQCGGAWELGPRSAAEVKKAATHYERAAALSPAPAMKAEFAVFADLCRCQAELM